MIISAYFSTSFFFIDFLDLGTYFQNGPWCPPMSGLGFFSLFFFHFFSFGLEHCYDIAVTQMNYPSLNKQYIIEQVRGRSHEEVLV